MENSYDLVARVRNGDPKAFGEIYDRYGRLIRAVCYDRLSNQADAEDLAQEVFLRAYRRLDQLRQPERFGHWLVGIARSMSTDWLRRKGAVSQPTMEPFFDQLSPIADESLRFQLDELRQAIIQLPERERTAIHIFYLSEQPASVAQEVLQLSSAGFYKLLERARGKLAVIMKRLQGTQP